MSYLTYIFPIAAALGVIYMAWRWTPIFADPFEDAPEPPAQPEEGAGEEAAPRRGERGHQRVSTQPIRKELIAMPKLKTHSGAKKRFNLTKTGKVKRAHAYKSHILTKKDTKRKRGLRQGTYADVTNESAIKRMIPYK